VYSPKSGIGGQFSFEPRLLAEVAFFLSSDGEKISILNQHQRETDFHFMRNKFWDFVKISSNPYFISRFSRFVKTL
jgi:hypothetical protein